MIALHHSSCLALTRKHFSCMHCEIPHAQVLATILAHGGSSTCRRTRMGSPTWHRTLLIHRYLQQYLHWGVVDLSSDSLGFVDSTSDSDLLRLMQRDSSTCRRTPPVFVDLASDFNGAHLGVSRPVCGLPDQSISFMTCHAYVSTVRPHLTPYKALKSRIRPVRAL